jgi:hypothetical protein
MTPGGIARRRTLAGLLLVAVAVAAFVAGASAGRPRTGAIRFPHATAARGTPSTPSTPGSPPSPRDWQRSVASTFSDYGGALACGGVLAPEQLGIASRTEPCGTLVTLAYRGRVVRVPVIDRGPYVDGREWDLTGATARALRFPGLDEIDWRR